MSENRRPNSNGKGSAPRPIPDRDRFERNWDQIFKKKGGGQ